jgi:hypothetical protein
MGMSPLTAGETANGSKIFVVHLDPDTLSYREGKIELDSEVSSDE